MCLVQFPARFLEIQSSLFLNLYGNTQSDSNNLDKYRYNGKNYSTNFKAYYLAIVNQKVYIEIQAQNGAIQNI